MLRSASEVRGYTLLATDGELGRCKDFLFDDEFWTVRFMVADTTKWLPGRKVLVSPISLETPDWASGTIPVKLAKREIKSAPDLDEHAPVSRQYEKRYLSHYGWPLYWGGSFAWGMGPQAAALFSPEEALDEERQQEEEVENDRHLRSMSEVLHYEVTNHSDGRLGSIDDFIIEDGTWTIRYLVVDIGGKMRGPKVLLSPLWIGNVNWKERRVAVEISQEALDNSPHYDPAMPVNRAYEELLFDFHGRPHYWDEPAAVPAEARRELLAGKHQ